MNTLQFDETRCDWILWRAEKMCDRDPELSFEDAKRMAGDEYDMGEAW